MNLIDPHLRGQGVLNALPVGPGARRLQITDLQDGVLAPGNRIRSERAASVIANRPHRCTDYSTRAQCHVRST